MENNEIYDPEIFTLTDDEGNELNFALLGSLEHEDNVNKARVPVDENGEETSDEYVILKCVEDEDGETLLETIEDDEEWENVADIFDDEFANIFYDEDSEG